MPPRAKKSVKNDRGGKRHPLNVRTTFETRQRLEKAAIDSGRSLTQEAEVRIERSFHSEDFAVSALEMTYGAEIAGIALAVADVLHTAAIATRALLAHDVLDGSGWMDDPVAFNNAVKGVQVLLDGLRPPGEPSPIPVRLIGPDATQEVLDALPDQLKVLIASLREGGFGATVGARKLLMLAGKESVVFSREEMQKRLLAPTMKRIADRATED